MTPPVHFDQRSLRQGLHVSGQVQNGAIFRHGKAGASAFGVDRHLIQYRDSGAHDLAFPGVERHCEQRLAGSGIQQPPAVEEPCIAGVGQQRTRHSGCKIQQPDFVPDPIRFDFGEQYAATVGQHPRPEHAADLARFQALGITTVARHSPQETSVGGEHHGAVLAPVN